MKNQWIICLSKYLRVLVSLCFTTNCGSIQFELAQVNNRVGLFQLLLGHLDWLLDLTWIV